MLRKALRITAKTILGFIGFVLLYLLSAYLLSSIAVNEDAPVYSDLDIYIKTNGVHTDLVLPVKSELIDWSKEIQFQHTKLTDTNYHYLAMGWGDKGFYLETPTWADLKFSVAFKAAFALSTTAIHTTYYQVMEENESCRRITISRDQYAQLIDYIQQSFKKDESGRVMHIPTSATYGISDAFYDATGHYSMFHTCNTWANNGLKHCGLKSCLWTPFDSGIFSKYSNN